MTSLKPEPQWRPAGLVAVHSEQMAAAPMADLLEHLELPQCECLNEAKGHTLRHCLEQGSREQESLFLQSDCDEELLITLRFMAPVRVGAIVVQGPADKAPAKVRLFANKLGLDFDTAKSEVPTQELVLAPGDVAKDSGAVQLRFVNFQNVTSLSLFVPENQGGGDETVVTKLSVLGAPHVHEGVKRSASEQAAASKADWLGKGVA